MKVIFSKEALKEYRAWEISNPRVNDKIVDLIFDIMEHGLLEGIGNPEQLKRFKDPPRFSRRISKGNRLVYSPTEENDLLIVSCKGHYDGN